jgi:hypothetical protein
MTGELGSGPGIGNLLILLTCTDLLVSSVPHTCTFPSKCDLTRSIKDFNVCIGVKRVRSDSHSNFCREHEYRALFIIGMFIWARLTPYQLHAEKGGTSEKGVTLPNMCSVSNSVGWCLHMVGHLTTAAFSSTVVKWCLLNETQTVYFNLYPERGIKLGYIKFP